MNLNEMTIEELNDLSKEITIEIRRREKREKIIVTHECKDSSNYHLNKGKHWIKIVSKIDDSKTNGFAFEGTFLSVQNENLVHPDDFIVEVCLGKMKFYRACDGQEKAIEGSKSNFVTFIRECKEAMEKQ